MKVRSESSIGAVRARGWRRTHRATTLLVPYGWLNAASLGSVRETRSGWQLPELGGCLMAIVVGFDVHRRQIMLDALDTETGEVRRGRIDATALAVEDAVTVSVEEILAAMRLLFERLKTVAEPSGASALAVVIAGRVQIPAGGRVG
jgi:hypothetical protein